MPVDSEFPGPDVDLLVEVGSFEGRRQGLERALRHAIQTGRLRSGDRLPSSRTLAQQLGFARGTVLAAFEQLTVEGYLRTRARGRTTVAEIGALSMSADDQPVTAGVKFDLRPGEPDTTMFPGAAWLAAMRRVLGEAAGRLGYVHMQGRPELRQALAGYLARARGVRAASAHIVVSSGYSAGLFWICRLLVQRGMRTIAMEDPCFGLHREIVEQAGASVTPIEVDGLGLNVAALRQSEARAVIVTPAHQYPTGVTLHPTRRAELLAWAREQDGLVIEDDYDGEFRFDRQPIGSLQGLDPARVIYGGTASKSLAPGLRLGWLVLPPELLEDVPRAQWHASAASALDQLVLADLIESYVYDRQVRRLRLHYRRRRDRLVAALASAGLEGRIVASAAGLHLLLALPEDGPKEVDVLARAAEIGLAIHGLETHWYHDRPIRRARDRLRPTN